MSRRALFAGALLAATLGWPVGEGLWALTWTPASHVVGAEGGAADRLLTAHREVIFALLSAKPDKTVPAANCLDQLLARALSGPSDLNGDFAKVLKATAERIDQGEVEQVAYNSLRNLPHSVLGALDGCVSGSLLAPICGAWVASRMRAALAASEPQLRLRREAGASIARRLACRVLHTG